MEKLPSIVLRRQYAPFRLVIRVHGSDRGDEERCQDSKPPSLLFSSEANWHGTARKTWPADSYTRTPHSSSLTETRLFCFRFYFSTCQLKSRSTLLSIIFFFATSTSCVCSLFRPTRVARTDGHWHTWVCLGGGSCYWFAFFAMIHQFESSMWKGRISFCKLKNALEF